MSNPKTLSELAASLRTMFAARVSHLVAAGTGPAFAIVGTADRLEDIQRAADILEQCNMRGTWTVAPGAPKPVFCGADCVDEGLCRDTQSCDRVGAASVGRVNVAPTRPASADRSDVGNAWAVLTAHGFPDDGKTRLDDMILRAITAAPAAPVAQRSVVDYGDVLARVWEDSLHLRDLEAKVAFVARAVERACAEAWGVRIEGTDHAAAPAAPVAQPVSAPDEFREPATCPAREAMGVHACQDRAQCWEPCGALGQSAAHVAVSKDYAPAPGVESEGGDA